MRAILRQSFLVCVVLLFIPGLVMAQGNQADDIQTGNQFAFDLYAKYKTNDGNVFFSPSSLFMAFGMVYEGARGSTADEIQSVFHFSKDDEGRRHDMRVLYNRANSGNSSYKLKIANALWVQKDYKLLDAYLEIIEGYYGGKAINLDFIKEAEPARGTINTWVEEQTNGKIKDLIPSGLLGESTRLVLTNTVYFKGNWLIKFDKKSTRESDFRLSSGEAIKVPMMSLVREHFDYAETEDLQILELPYEGNGLSMIILLPRNDNLKKVEESLNIKNLSLWRNLFKEEKMDVYVPRFKFETKYFMVKDLQGLGMSMAFSDKADFSGMTALKDLSISEVIHQAFVEVNEEGTEAAAATAMTMVCTAMPDENESKIFKADHPFIFLIQDKITGNILFLGRVENPNSV